MRKLVCGLILALFVSSAALAADVEYYGGGGGGGGAGANSTGVNGGAGGDGGSADNAGGAGGDSDSTTGGGGGGGGAAIDVNYTSGGNSAAGTGGTGGTKGTKGASNIGTSNDGVDGEDGSAAANGGDGGDGGNGGSANENNSDSSVDDVTLIAGSGGNGGEPGSPGNGGVGGAGGGITLTFDTATSVDDIKVEAGAGGDAASSASGSNGGAGGAGGSVALTFGTATSGGAVTVTAGAGGDAASAGSGSAGGDAALTFSASGTVTLGNIDVTSGLAASGGKATFKVADTLITPSLKVTKQGSDVTVDVKSLDVTGTNTTLTAIDTGVGEFKIGAVTLGGGNKLTVDQTDGTIGVESVTMASGATGTLAIEGATLELTSLTVNGATLTLDLSGSAPTPAISVTGTAVGSVDLDGATVNVTGISALTTNVTLISSVNAIAGTLAGGSLTIGGSTYPVEIDGTNLVLSSTATSSNPPVTPSNPGSNTSQLIADLISVFNKTFSPHAVTSLAIGSETKTQISSKGVDNATAITKSNAFTINKKDTPTLPMAGYESILPSFTSAIKLGGNTTGNVLALSFNMNLGAVAGFGQWGTLKNDARTALLETTGVIIAYEFPTDWSTLVGNRALMSWSKATQEGIVKFNENGLEFLYAVTDSVGDPYEAGDMIVIPDGKSDGEIIDPVWLLRKQTVTVMPTAVTLTPDSLTLKRGASGTIKASFTPTDASERDLVWTVSPSGIASVSKAAMADTWTVTALAEGTATLSAAVDADRTISKTVSLSVVAATDDDQGGGSSGCQGFAPGSMMLMGLFAMLCALPVVGKKR